MKPTEHKSTCCYCGVGCGVIVTDHGEEQLSLRGDESHPSSKGMLCSKGMNLHYTAMDKTDGWAFLSFMAFSKRAMRA
ncbi:MAG: hypothetical protein LH606_18545 [Cytophagaceae bacterium]|nr:hypothetical protein [Cytophagaceae bacterium]